MAPIGSLYTYEGNARCLKVLAVAKLNGLEIDVPPFDISCDHQKPEYFAKFPVGKVPGFETPSGIFLAESCAIAHFLAKSGPKSVQLLGKSIAEEARIQQWIHFSEGELFPSVVDMVLPRVGRRGYEAWLDERAVKQIEFAMQGTERHLQDGKKWMATEDAFSLADLTLASAFYWAFKVIVDAEMRKPFPRTVEWYQRVVHQDVVKDVFVHADLVETRWPIVRVATEKR